MDNPVVIIALYVVIIGAFYLIAIRPQKKQEKEHQALVSSVGVGDSILDRKSTRLNSSHWS